MRKISYIFCLVCFVSATGFIQAGRSQVWVLHDEDVLDVASSSAARDACTRSFRPLGYETDYIPIEKLLCEERNWDACALLVIPGGQTTKIEEKMGDKGRGILQVFHEKGGHCLGICGGAFLLSQTTQYDGISSGDILHRYALAPVHSKGPYPGGEPRCLPVSVWREGKKVSSLSHLEAWWAHGGVMELIPHSLPDGDKLDVIARYSPGRSKASVEEPISILKYQPSSRGQVILSHVHIEYPRSSEFLWEYIVSQFALPPLAASY